MSVETCKIIILPRDSKGDDAMNKIKNPKYYFHLVLTLIMLVNSAGVSGEKSHIAYAQQDSISERYIIFLGGIRSKSSEEKPIDRSFNSIQNYLKDNLGISRFTYFSYSAI